MVLSYFSVFWHICTVISLWYRCFGPNSLFPMCLELFQVIIMVKKTFKLAKIGYYQDKLSVLTFTNDNLMQEISSKTPENRSFYHKMCVRVLRWTKIGHLRIENVIFNFFRKLQFWLISASFSDFLVNFRCPNSLQLTPLWSKGLSGTS